MKLSSNFSLRELTKSQTAERKGIDNTPTEEHTENLKLLCENILQPTRDEWGVVSVSSGYRSPALCVAIGSSEKSQHARGMAADFECHSVDNKELFDWVTSNLDYDQAILEFYTGSPESGWLHVSYNKDGNRKQRLKAFRNDAGKPQYEEIYRHIQPIILPLPSFIMCRFIVSTYPVSFSLKISQRSKQFISLNSSTPSNIFFVTGIK